MKQKKMQTLYYNKKLRTEGLETIKLGVGVRTLNINVNTIGFSEALYDNTDHFGFICSCKNHLNIFAIDLDEQNLQIYFLMACPKCKAQYKRKIFIEADKNKRAMPRVYDEGKIRDIQPDEKHLTEIAKHKWSYRKRDRWQQAYQEFVIRKINMFINALEEKKGKSYSSKKIIKLFNILKKNILKIYNNRVK